MFFSALHALRVFDEQQCIAIRAILNKFDSRGQPRFLGAHDMLNLDWSTSCKCSIIKSFEGMQDDRIIGVINKKEKRFKNLENFIAKASQSISRMYQTFLSSFSFNY